MTKLEQAARQALGALEVATTPLAKDRQEVLRAITTLREALSGGQALSAAPAEQQAAPKTAPGDAIDEALLERDEAEDFIDALLDEVLGHERPEWSNLYGRADALNDVQERMASLHKPAVDKAWGQFQSAMAAPQQEAQDATVAAFEAVRKKLCTLPRYSFVLDDDGLVRRAPDRTGNWIEFDEAHALFDPVSVDAAIAAQGGKT